MHLTFVHANTQSKKALFETAIQGLSRHGFKAINQAFAPEAEIIGCWGWRAAKAHPGKKVLVFENGYLGERGTKWISLAWNGLNGRGTFFTPKAVTGNRFDQHFELKPWKQKGEYIVIMGQVKGDQSLMGKNMTPFYERVAEEAGRHYKMPVYFKPHPVGMQRNANFKPQIPIIEGNMEDVLSNAHLVITFNSNSAVDAVINGVPALSYDIGSMAYDVTGHSVEERIMPDRKAWAHRLAWCQWTRDEIALGDYWPYLSQFLSGDYKSGR